MKWIVAIIVLCMYCSLSNRLDKIIKLQTDATKKSFPSLHQLVGKYISIETDDDSDFEFDDGQEGRLKKFNQQWLVLETLNQELYYYRLRNITSIDVIEEDMINDGKRKNAKSKII